MSARITHELDKLTDIQLECGLIPRLEEGIEALEKYHRSDCGMCDECEVCDEMESLDWESIDQFINLSPFSISEDDYKRALLEVRAELINRTF